MPTLGKAFVNIRANMKGLRVDLKAAKGLVIGALKGMSKVATAIPKLIGKTIKTAIVTSMKIVKSVVQKSFAAIVKIAKVSAVAIAGALTASIVAFAGFENSMRTATSVSEVTEAQFVKMSKMAREQAIRLNMSAKELATGFYFLGSAGLSVTDQMKAFVSVATLAKAGNLEMGRSAEIVVDTMKGFKISFDETKRVTDTMAKAVTSSNQTFGQLGEALSKVSGVARIGNNTLEDTVAALAAMSDVGIKGALAGTQLRMAILRMMAPMSDSRKLMKEYGIEIFDSSGKMKAFITILGDISEKLKGASEEQRNLAFKTLFGRRAVSSQIALLDKGRVALRAYSDAIRDAGGAADTIAEKNLRSLGEQFGRLWQMIKDVGIIIGEALNPALLGSVKNLQELTTKISKFVSDNKFKLMEWALIVKGTIEAAFNFIVNLWKNDELGNAVKFALDVAMSHFERWGQRLLIFGTEIGKGLGDILLGGMSKKIGEGLIKHSGAAGRSSFMTGVQFPITGAARVGIHNLGQDLVSASAANNVSVKDVIDKALLKSLEVKPEGLTEVKPEGLTGAVEDLTDELKKVREDAKAAAEKQKEIERKTIPFVGTGTGGAGGLGGGGKGIGGGGAGGGSPAFVGLSEAFKRLATQTLGKSPMMVETTKQTTVLQKTHEVAKLSLKNLERQTFLAEMPPDAVLTAIGFGP